MGRFRRFFIVLSIPFVVYLLFVILPLLTSILRQTPADLWEVWRTSGIATALGLSFAAATSAALVAALLCVPGGYLLARYDFPGKHLVEAIADLPLTVPHTVAGIVLLFVFGSQGLIGSVAEQVGLSFYSTFWGVLVAMLFVSAPFMLNQARAGFGSVPVRLEQAARTLGAPPAQVFWRISLPLARSGVLSGLLLTWARAVSEVGAVSVIAYYPMTAPVHIYDMFQSSGLRVSGAEAVILLLAVLLFFLLCRWVIAQLGQPRTLRASKGVEGQER